MENNNTFEKKTLPNGKTNPKYVDVLDTDKPIAGQNFCCVSFLSPEKIIKDKDRFFFEQFVKRWDFTKSMEKFTQFVNFISFKYKLNSETLMKDYEEFVEEERKMILESSIEDDYKNFIDNNEEKLEKEFGIKHNFQTSVRGVKVRGSYSTQEEAELRAKMLREIDDGDDIFVGQVGVWLMWEPEAYKTGRVEYLEEELNNLMQKKNENEKHAKNMFESRMKETKKKAIEENIKSSEKTGNALTQNIDENGNLIGVNKTSQEKTFSSSSENITIEDIRNELFEGDNIVIDKKTDHGKSELISGPFASKKKE